MIDLKSISMEDA